MKRSILPALLALLTALPSARAGDAVSHDEIRIKAPFEMPAIKVPVFPKRDFVVTDYGAVAETVISDAIRKAIAACHKAGGGRVLIPGGKWLTGKIHLRSNVNLHLAVGAVLTFSDDPADYLPAVQSSWEGMECFNYSPLIYAFDCTNVAITGKGTIEAEMGTWKKWSGRPPAHLEASKKLYHMASTDVPVGQRQMARDGANMRPQFIQLNRCRNVLIEDVKIRNSPFWTIHLLLCESAVVRRADIRALGHNNDGIDPEMTRNLLVEDCVFDQGDDAIAIKSGRNRDGWRLDTPTENVVIRNCTVRNGHQLVAIGSELSGGIRNVYVHDCTFENTPGKKPFNLLFIKTNHRRGGFVENIHMERIKAKATRDSVFAIETDVLYQWRDLVPDYETRITKIRGIHVRDIRLEETHTPFRILGDKRLPVEDVTLENITVEKARNPRGRIENAKLIRKENVRVLNSKAEAGSE